MKKFIQLIIVLSFIIHLANGQESSTIKVSDNLYMISGLGGNVALLITTEGVVVIDAGTAPDHGRIISDIIKEKTDLPIKYILLTHYHFDHVMGLQSFDDDAIIIGHTNLLHNYKTFNIPGFKERLENTTKRITKLEDNVEQMKKDNNPEVEKELEKLRKNKESYESLKDFKYIFPDVCFNKELTIYLGNDTVTIINPGNAHTSGNAVVFLPNQKTVHMGDMLFHKCHPYVDWRAGSNTKNWMQYLGDISKWEIDHVIPGHGDLTDKSGLTDKISYFEKARKLVQEKVDKNLSLEDTQKAITADQFEELGFDFILPRTVEGIYMEMTK